MCVCVSVCVYIYRYPKISKINCSLVVPLFYFVVNKEHTILHIFYVPSDEQSTFQV